MQSHRPQATRQPCLMCLRSQARECGGWGLPEAKKFVCLFPTRQERVARFYVGIRVCDASTPRPHPPTQYPARAARQWIPPSIPPEQLASASRRVSRQSCSPVDPAKYLARAAGQWIPPSIPPELLASESIPPEWLASGSRRVSRHSGSHQSSPPVDPAR